MFDIARYCNNQILREVLLLVVIKDCIARHSLDGVNRAQDGATDSGIAVISIAKEIMD